MNNAEVRAALYSQLGIEHPQWGKDIVYCSYVKVFNTVIYSIEKESQVYYKVNVLIPFILKGIPVRYKYDPNFIPKVID